MVDFEVYRQPKLTDPYDLGPFRRDLQTGVIPGSLEPNGLFAARNGLRCWSPRLLNCAPQSHYIETGDKGLSVYDMTRAYKLTNIPFNHLRRVYFREFLYVGNLGFLLNENQDMFDEFRMASFPEAEGSDWWNQALEVRVDPSYRFQWVDLIGLWGYCLQQKDLEDDLVVISGQLQILPSAWKVITVADHDFFS